MNRPRALVSVYDKTGLDVLARGLHACGVDIVSTGSTAAKIRELDVPVTEVAEVTGFPEIMDGRVKTLHPLVHGGLLGREEDKAVMDEHGIEPFILMVGNLYPFADTVASGAPFEECIEQIDIGGPTMVRAAAKNHKSVGVVTDPADYQGVVDELQVTGSLSAETRLRLACKAFQHTAAYDAAVATWFSEQTEEEFPDTLNLSFEKSSLAMRYGENPHQRAALYVDPTRKGSLARAIQHSGKDMSRNNYVDIDAAWRAVHDFANPCVAIIKHTNPCGIAIGADVADAERKAHDCDPVSAFGGVIAANRPVSVAMAQQVVAEGRFTEVIAAAAYEDGALEVLATKKSLRVLEVKGVPGDYLELRQFDGGLLVQTTDYVDQEGDDPSNWTLVAGKPADATTLADLAFAWRACRSVKSNAILLARDGASVGVGMGQVNRVDSCRLAVERASDPRRSVAASDAFFPFDDGPRVLIESGVKAIVEPGGSIRDQDTIALCEQSGITLYFTGVRHFAH